MSHCSRCCYYGPVKATRFPWWLVWLLLCGAIVYGAYFA